jgi:glucose/arabinose dehydrogenase
MRRLATAGALALFLVLAAALPSSPAAAASRSLRLVEVDDTADLTAMAARPGTRTLYVTHQDGVVWSLRDGTRTPAVDLTGRVSQDGGERGLLGLAFSPDGKKLYVDYTDRNGDTQVDELQMKGRAADESTRRTVIEIEQPQANHNGGQLAFGPDGLLYIGLGDGGAADDVGPGHAPDGNGQSLGTLLGKILRIDPTPSAGAAYTVPADNPFVRVAGARPEIWAYGLRNPWRFSFDTRNGDLWIADVGQNEVEEIDRVQATNGRGAGRGDNFGWNRLEGSRTFQGRPPADAVGPVHEIDHDTGACAVVGGYVARAGAPRRLLGSYLFGDNCDPTIRLLRADGNGGFDDGDTGLELEGVSSFGQSNGGALYVLSLTKGVFRIAGG